MADATPPPERPASYHLAILYPTRAELADALIGLINAGIQLDGASDHGVSEALYLRDPDGNGVELYWDRPKEQWPHDADGNLAMVTEPLDLQSASPTHHATHDACPKVSCPSSRSKASTRRSPNPIAVDPRHKASGRHDMVARGISPSRPASNARIPRSSMQPAIASVATCSKSAATTSTGERSALVKELGTPCLRYGLPNHLIHLGPDRYDWSFADEAMAEIQRLGITPILDLMHFGIPDWMGDFQNPEMPLLFAEYAGAVAQRYPWVRGYTPVNEIYVSARNSGWDGLWNERLRTERGFVTGAEAPGRRQPAGRAPRSRGIAPTRSSCRARSRRVHASRRSPLRRTTSSCGTS